MQTPNGTLISEAYQTLKGKWAVPMAALLLYIAILIPIQVLIRFVPLAGYPANIIISAPLMLGFIILTLNIARNKEAVIGQLFDGFNVIFTAVIANLLVGVFVILGFILLIIPAFIVMAHLALVFYVIADEPEISPIDALKKSKELMYGYKWKYIRFILRILGLVLLSFLTLGIALLWVIPVAQVAMARFYDDVKSNPITQTI